MSDERCAEVPATAAEMWRLARTVADPSMLDKLTVLAIARCGKGQGAKSGSCGRPLATLYATRLGPVLVAFVPDDDHVLAAIEDPKSRMEFAASRDRWLAARSEVDVVDATVGDGWHPAAPQVLCSKHGPLEFDRDSFVEQGRKLRAKPLMVAIHPLA